VCTVYVASYPKTGLTMSQRGKSLVRLATSVTPHCLFLWYTVDVAFTVSPKLITRFWKTPGLMAFSE